MIYVGIDIAKLNHFASALSSDGEILLQPFSFSNSYDGFCKLQTNNQTFKAYYDKKMADGRQHYNTLGHCAGKLVRILYKMLTENIAFQLS